MNLGRPANRRKRIIRTLMNEKEERFFLAYFENWKTNNEITDVFNKNSPKKISTSVGDYCNKFLGKKWFNKREEYRRYTFITPSGKEATKGQYVPAYKSNIKPFMDYFIFTANDSELTSLLSDKYAVSLLYLFFELKEVREYISLISQVTFGKPLNVYTSFLHALERKLVYYWLYFDKRFYSNLKKIVVIEEFSINQIPNIEEIKFFIEKYLKTKKDDFEKFELREKIIDLYNSSWKKFEKLPCFKKIILKLNALQNKGLNKKMLKEAIKIKYFARLLYLESSAKAIREAFMGFVANSLVQMQSKKEQDPNHLKLLKYQLFNKHIPRE